MSNKGRVKVGIIGSQFEADIQAESIRIMPDEAEVVAVASPTPGNAAQLSKRHNIPRVFTDYKEMLAERDIEMVTIAAPNDLHALRGSSLCLRKLCVKLKPNSNSFRDLPPDPSKKEKPTPRSE